MYGLGDLCSILKADEQAILVQHLDVADQLSDREFIEIREAPLACSNAISSSASLLSKAAAPRCSFPAQLLGHELGFGHVDLLKFFIIVGTVSAGTDDQLEQLQLAFLQVPDLMFHGR